MEIIGVEGALREPVKRLHAYTGHLFAITFFLRVIWGFMGNEHARWRDMIPYDKERRRAVVRSLRWYAGGFKGVLPSAAGHDPLASLFYVALFLVLMSQVATGLVLGGIEFDLLPGTLFVGVLGKEALEVIGEAAEGLHEFGFFFIIFFISAHLVGLVAHEVKAKTGLLSSMIHGKKYFPKVHDRL
jgi:Ni,Fe-hydrogenase I cytochrome b subunit